MKKEDIKKFEKHYEESYQIGLKIIINEAIQIMNRYPKYKSFYIAIGTWFFEEKGIYQGKPYRELTSDAPCMNQLREFLGDYNSELKFTGESIKVYPNGIVEQNF